MNTNAQEPDGATATVAGRVTAGGQPQAEATVMIVEGGDHPDIAALSNEEGRYQLGGLAAGRYRLEARLGDRSRQRELVLGQGEQAVLDFGFD